MEKSTKRYSRRDAARGILMAGVAGLTATQMASAAPQPHMRAALQALENAAASLEKAVDDKGGHRVKAIGFVKEAIAQVERGIQAGNR